MWSACVGVCQSRNKFHENPSSGSRVVPCGRTDGHEDNIRFSQFRESVPKISQCAASTNSQKIKLSFIKQVIHKSSNYNYYFSHYVKHLHFRTVLWPDRFSQVKYLFILLGPLTLWGSRCGAKRSGCDVTGEMLPYASWCGPKVGKVHFPARLIYVHYYLSFSQCLTTEVTSELFKMNS